VCCVLEAAAVTFTSSQVCLPSKQNVHVTYSPQNAKQQHEMAGRAAASRLEACCVRLPLCLHVAAPGYAGCSLKRLCSLRLGLVGRALLAVWFDFGLKVCRCAFVIGPFSVWATCLEGAVSLQWVIIGVCHLHEFH
jgi:hypothetical protein